jgi:uncharacterized protein YjlB
MYALESAKSTFERWTGVGRPSRQEAASRVRKRKAWGTRFADDGLIPNNPQLPFIHYRSAVDLTRAADPAAIYERLFGDNGWGGSWRNGIYDYVHYHPRTHEVLGIASGKARVRFGGAKGKVIALKAGDVVVLPAGTGHKRETDDPEFLVVGAYPPGQDWDLRRGDPAEHDEVVANIARVPDPESDPVGGSLAELWT